MIHADSFELMRCGNPKCRAIHLVLLDVEGNNVASAALDVADVPSVTKALQDIAYEVAALKEDT